MKTEQDKAIRHIVKLVTEQCRYDAKNGYPMDIEIVETVTERIITLNPVSPLVKQKIIKDACKKLGIETKYREPRKIRVTKKNSGVSHIFYFVHNEITPDEKNIKKVTIQAKKSKKENQELELEISLNDETRETFRLRDIKLDILD